MNRYIFRLLVCCIICVQYGWGAYPGEDDSYPFAPPAGEPGSTAIHKDDASIVAWASGYEELVYGSSVAEQWKTPVKALGAAVGDSFDVVSLGGGGQITLTFTNPIRDGGGADFAVFENAFSDTFLELAWVEVSTDGIHFVRFPNFSYTPALTGSVDATFIHGYASKYRQAYGTPFDLEQLEIAYQAALGDEGLFSADYRAQLIGNYTYLDLADIRYVRLIDIVGDGSAFDSDGFEIYDPYPTSGSAGLDLEAVAVIHQVTPVGDAQTITFPELEHQRLSGGGVTLMATASSGLPVAYQVLEGPATVSGDRLSFTAYGQVVVQATQSGDETYAPAISVTRSFYIAEELQHIYFEPVANQMTHSTVPLRARTTSGFIAVVEVASGPSDVSAGFPPNQSLATGSSVGQVTLRAYQVGGVLNGVTYAPAKDVFMTVEVVAPSSENAPINFSSWQLAHSISGSQDQDSDLDGAADFEEYVAATNPNDASERPRYPFERNENGDYCIEIAVSRLASVRVQMLASDNLQDVESWEEVLPELIESHLSTEGAPLRTLTLKLSSAAATQNFWRFTLSENN